MREQKQAYERKLAEDIGSFAFDPLGFVLYAFPWGEGALAGKTGPEPWQREELEIIGRELKSGASAEQSEAGGDSQCPDKGDAAAGGIALQDTAVKAGARRDNAERQTGCRDSSKKHTPEDEKAGRGILRYAQNDSAPTAAGSGAEGDEIKSTPIKSGHDGLDVAKVANPTGSGEPRSASLQKPRFLEATPECRTGSAAEGYAIRSTAARAVRRAISSGHGIGKSAFVAWIILWALSTLPDTRGVVTANTEGQLKGKTWAELAKWHRLCLTGHWFDCTATALISKLPGRAKTWRCDMAPWSERTTEAFAGLHNKDKRVLLIFDEASAIPDSVWEVSEGALTDEDTEIIWIVCGNPTRNSGRFRECFGKFRHRWGNRQVDSREVSLTNKAQISQWIDDYGADSDFVRVRVRGVFPRAGGNQLISNELVAEGAARSLREGAFAHAPLIFGLDVARFGDDQSVLTKRQGLIVQPQLKWRNLDLMTLAGLVARHIDADRPDAVFVDMGGLGAGVVDRLHQLGYEQTLGVDFGGQAAKPPLHVNKRTEMWCALHDWLKNGGALPADPELAADLTGPEYGFTGDKGQIALEKKADMKKRGLASPDCGDSLALTFALPVARRDHTPARGKAKTEYDLWEYGLS